MYIIVAPIQIKEAFKDQYIKGMRENAQRSVNDEPGCLRFDVVQDANDENRIWLYEVYKDEAAFQAHTQTPHFTKFRDMSGLPTVSQTSSPEGIPKTSPRPLPRLFQALPKILKKGRRPGSVNLWLKKNTLTKYRKHNHLGDPRRVHCGRPRHPRRARIRNPAYRAGDGTPDPGEQTSPGAGDPIREVGIRLCLKESDGSEAEKYQKDYTLRPGCLTFLKAQLDFRGPGVPVP